MSILLPLIVIPISLSLFFLFIYINREEIYKSTGVVNPSVRDILAARTVDTPNIFFICLWLSLTLAVCVPIILAVFLIFASIIAVIFCLVFATGYLIKLMLSNQVKVKKLEML